MGDIENEMTDELVCPYCGAEQDCSWEYPDDSGDANCDECGKTFHYEREIEVSYTTWVKESEADHEAK